jgi:hypothetical protein
LALSIGRDAVREPRGGTVQLDAGAGDGSPRAIGHDTGDASPEGLADEEGVNEYKDGSETNDTHGELLSVD